LISFHIFRINSVPRLYQACGILGATVMPHSLYLGSGIVQPRLLEYDIKNGHVIAPSDETPDSSFASEKPQYHPSLAAINFCLKFSIFELAMALFTFALFVNSAILIVAGASLSDIEDASDASLFGIYDLLAESLGSAAGKIFALALLLSGISAGIVCTIAGQMVSEGALNWTVAPWLRRLITRSISIIPSIIIAGAVGKDGLTAALNGSQVALSVVLPFVSAPLIYFTCRNKFMSVRMGATDLSIDHEDDEENESTLVQREGATITNAPTGNRLESGVSEEGVKMRNHWAVTALAVIIWFIMAAMNVANLVLVGLGKS
jgi:metal iron transporter